MANFKLCYNSNFEPFDCLDGGHCSNLNYIAEITGTEFKQVASDKVEIKLR